MNLKYIVNNNCPYNTLKEVLKAHFRISDRLLLKLKKSDKIYLNSRSTYLDKTLTLNDVIEIHIDFEEDNSNIVPTKINLDIIHEDDGLLIVNKPAGIPVHPSMDHYEDSLSNGIRYYFDEIRLKKKIRPVNRLDKNTSGLVIFAKNEYIQECLIKQMKSGIFYKEYIAICEGKFKEPKGTIDAPIARKRNSIIERCVNENGDIAITEYEVLNYNEVYNYSVVKCVLKTGRTHQIRVHLSYIGHPILGDTLYGNSSQLIDRQALHAYKISFINPITNSMDVYKSPLYNDMLKLNYL